VVHCVVPDIPFSERRTFTLGEVAGLLGVTVSTLYAMRKRGELSTIKIAGRTLVTRAELDRLTSPQPRIDERPIDQPQHRGARSRRARSSVERASAAANASTEPGR
jgi:excisionase family DNA binding protein